MGEKRFFPAADPNAPPGCIRVNVRKGIERAVDFPLVLASKVPLSIAVSIEPAIALTLPLEPTVALSAVVHLEPGGDFLKPRFDGRIHFPHVPDHARFDAQFKQRRLCEFAKVTWPAPFLVMEPIKVTTPFPRALKCLPSAIVES
jgi:hypothetical protein